LCVKAPNLVNKNELTCRGEIRKIGWSQSLSKWGFS